MGAWRPCRFARPDSAVCQAGRLSQGRAGAPVPRQRGRASILPDEFPDKFSPNFAKKLKQTNIPTAGLKHFRKPGYDQIIQAAIDYSDGIALTKDIKKRLLTYVEKSGKPVLQHPDDDNYVDMYDEFYDELLASDANETL